MIYPAQTNVHIVAHADLDGETAGAIVKQHHPEASVIITNYNKPLRINKFKPGDIVYVVDFSLPKEVFEEIKRKNIRIIWIDHHKSAIDSLTEQGWSCEGIRDVNYSGAALTWMYFNPDKGFEQAPDVVKLVNWYDLWQHDKDPRVRPLNYGMGLWDIRPGYVAGDLFWNKMFSIGTGDKLLNNAVEYGKIVQQYVEKLQTLLCQDLAYKTQITTPTGIRNVMAMAVRPGNSSIFEKMDLTGIDATMTCQYFASNVQKYRCSVYSPDSVKQILDIAIQFGGGGHPTAAGFTLPTYPIELPVRKQPPALKSVVDQYEDLYKMRMSSAVLMKFANRGNSITGKVCGWHSNIEGVRCMAFNYHYVPEMIPMLPTSVEIINDEGDIPELYVGYVLTNCGYYRCCAYPTSTSVDLHKMLEKLQNAYMKKVDEVAYKIEVINGGLWWYATEPPISIPIKLEQSAYSVG